MKLAQFGLSGSKIQCLMTGMMMIFLAHPLRSSVASAAPQPSQINSFEAWCQQKESVPAATRRTIDVLLKKAGTKNCKLADRQLKTLTDLDLGNNEISDVRPLAGLTNLTTLFLRVNKISDVKPLAGLTNLTLLWLNENQIKDVKPLAGLTNLTGLFLWENQINDIQPLAGLTNLIALFLGKNKISDVKPLAGLTKLTDLDLGGNPIAVKGCPVKPESICKF